MVKKELVNLTFNFTVVSFLENVIDKPFLLEDKKCRLILEDLFLDNLKNTVRVSILEYLQTLDCNTCFSSEEQVLALTEFFIKGYKTNLSVFNRTFYIRILHEYFKISLGSGFLTEENIPESFYQCEIFTKALKYSDFFIFIRQRKVRYFGIY